jgi:hypothetical protein
MAKLPFPGKFPAEKGKKGLFRLKIRTWTTMPLKRHIIATFRGLLSDFSPEPVIICRRYGTGKINGRASLIPQPWCGA